MKTFEIRVIEREVKVYHIAAEDESAAEEMLYSGEDLTPIESFPIDQEGPFTQEIKP